MSDASTGMSTGTKKVQNLTKRIIRAQALDKSLEALGRAVQVDISA